MYMSTQRLLVQSTDIAFISFFPGTSWSCPSPTLTPPFPLPPTEDDPVEALLQLAQNGREAPQPSTTSTGSTTIEAMESDEGIVSDQSNEFEDKKRMKVFVL